MGNLAVNGGILDLNGNALTVGLLGSLPASTGLITNSSTTAITLTVDQTSNAAYYGNITAATAVSA